MKKLFVFLLCIPFISFAQTRMPFVEYFTNTGCTNCPAWTQALDQALTSLGRAKVVVIDYHNANPSPADPFYQDDIQESSDRTNYYSVQGDPALDVDGTNVSSNSEIKTAIQFEMGQSSPLTIALSGTRNGRSGNVNAVITGNASGSWKLFAAVTETGLTYHGTNGEVTHNDVFRKILTTWSGVDGSSGQVQIPFALGTGMDNQLSPSDSTPWNIDSCRIVVWAQNTSTKAVYQAAQIWVNSLTVQSNNSFTFVTGDSIFSAPPPPKLSEDVFAVGYITNTSDSSLNYTAVREVNNLPANWTTAICLEFCAAPAVDTLPDYLPLHGRRQFLLHFDPDSIPSEASVTMKFYNTQNPSDSIVKQFHFSTNAPTQFISPAYQQTLQTDTIPVLWKTDLSGRVALQYSPDDSDWYAIDTVNIATGSYAWVPGFQAFNLRLRLVTSEGNILSSFFNMLPNAVSEPLPQSYALTCAPNPANTLVNIALQGYAIRRIALFDALGRLVYDNYINQPSPDMNVPISTSALLPGVYYARVFTSSKVFGSPVVVLH
jgi:hypothetical protein